MDNPKRQPYPTDQDRRWVYSDPEIDFRWSRLNRTAPFILLWMLAVYLFSQSVVKGDGIESDWGWIVGFFVIALLFLGAALPSFIYALRFHRVVIDRDANTCTVRAGFLGLQSRNTFALSDVVRVRTHHTTYARYKYVMRSKGSGYSYVFEDVTPVALETRDGVLVDLLCFGSDNRKHAEVLARLLDLPMRSAGADRNRPVSQLDESLIARLSRLPAPPALPSAVPPDLIPAPRLEKGTTVWAFPSARFHVEPALIAFAVVGLLCAVPGVVLIVGGNVEGASMFIFTVIFCGISWAMWFFSETRGATIQLDRQTLRYRPDHKTPWRSIPIGRIEELLLSPSRGKWRVSATSDTTSISLSPPLPEDAARWLRQSIEATLYQRAYTSNP